ncbi:MAG: hypothetical protein Q3966_09825, partial [Neisseria sp.]|nr:hypothetical protein [Neisseria sp.]
MRRQGFARLRGLVGKISGLVFVVTVVLLLGKQQHWGLHPKTPDEAQVQTTLLNEANLCRQTVAAGSGNVVSMTPMKVFQTDTAFPEAPNGWLVLSMEHSGSRDTAY